MLVIEKDHLEDSHPNTKRITTADNKQATATLLSTLVRIRGIECHSHWLIAESGCVIRERSPDGFLCLLSRSNETTRGTGLAHAHPATWATPLQWHGGFAKAIAEGEERYDDRNGSLNTEDSWKAIFLVKWGKWRTGWRQRCSARICSRCFQCAPCSTHLQTPSACTCGWLASAAPPFAWVGGFHSGAWDGGHFPEAALNTVGGNG